MRDRYLLWSPIAQWSPVLLQNVGWGILKDIKRIWLTGDTLSVHEPKFWVKIKTFLKNAKTNNSIADDLIDMLKYCSGEWVHYKELIRWRFLDLEAEIYPVMTPAGMVDIEYKRDEDVSV